MLRRLLPIVTVWPLVYAVFFLVTIVDAFRAGDESAISPWLIAGHLATFVLTLALIAVYELHLFRRNRSLDEEWRTIWAVLLAFFGPPAMLVYWWRHIRVAV